MPKYILASSNAHKAVELTELLNKASIEVLAAPGKLDIVEDGQSFQENALKKAQAYYEKYKTPVISDDSGIVVESLPNDLGIYSARFGGQGLSDKERALLLIEKLKTTDNRNAYFTCCLCFYLCPDEIYFFEGRVDGLISEEYKGEYGFGYDPVFIPKKFNDNRTLAQVPEWKNENSHRAVACEHALGFFT